MRIIIALLITLWACLALSGCDTNQLQTTQKVVHFVAYPDVNGTIVMPPVTDPNSAAILAIAADVEKIINSKPATSSDTLDKVIDIAVPVVASYGGWSGLAAIIAWNIWSGRKKKR